MERKLASRLQAGVKAWTQCLLGKKEDPDYTMDTDVPNIPTHKAGGDPNIIPLVHEIRITNQIMYLHPSLEEARYNIMQQLFSWEAVILSQSRIQSSRYQVSFFCDTIF